MYIDIFNLFRRTKNINSGTKKYSGSYAKLPIVEQQTVKPDSIKEILDTMSQKNIGTKKRSRDFSVDKDMTDKYTVEPPTKRRPDGSQATKTGSIPQSIRKMVWGHYIGYKHGVAKCWCCNEKEISQFEFECGHVDAKSKGGPDTVTNLRPICGTCNRSMGNQNMFEFQKKHGLPKKDSYWSWTKTLLGF